MDFPKGGIIGKTVGLARRLAKMDISSHAANAGYFILMSVFPALLLILSLLRYTTLDAQDLLALLEGFLPQSLMDWVERIVISTYAHTSTAVISLSAVGTLWSASKGIYGLMKGLNAIYGASEHRGWLRTRLLCAVYLVFFLLVLLLTLMLHVFGNTLVEFLRHRGGRPAWLGAELMMEMSRDVLDLLGNHPALRDRGEQRVCSIRPTTSRSPAS
jgi:YihY family inner membrane protein